MHIHACLVKITNLDPSSNNICVFFSKWRFYPYPTSRRKLTAGGPVFATAGEHGFASTISPVVLATAGEKGCSPVVTYLPLANTYFCSPVVSSNFLKISKYFNY